MRRHYILFISFFFIPFFFLACGGGGGGSSAPPGLAPSLLTKSTSSAVIKALTLGTEGVSVRQTLVLPVTDGSEPIVIESRLKGDSSPNLSDIARIFEEVQKFKVSSPSIAASEKIFRVGEVVTPFVQSCGSATVNHNGTPNDTSDDSFLITLDCSGFGAGLGSSASGSFSSGPIKVNNVITQYRLFYNNYRILNKITINDFQGGTPIGSSTESSFRNGEILLDVAPGNCFRGSGFENVAGSFNITGTDQRDSDGDGLFELDEAYALTNFVISIAETPACANGPVTMTLNGTQSFTNNNNAELSSSFTFNNVQLTITPTTKLINGLSTKGFENSLSGIMTITSGTFCVNSTHSITTETPFFTANGVSCAILGKQLLTNTSSGEVVAVSATAVGGLDIDVGNDGTVEDTFTDCKETTVCTAP